jgi:hypothetical protein
VEKEVEGGEVGGENTTEVVIENEAGDVITEVEVTVTETPVE